MRLRRAESVLSQRCGSIILVMEHVLDTHNVQAVLRTAEALGLLRVWNVKPAPGQDIKESGETVSHEPRKKKRKYLKSITKGCERWLELKEWDTSRACVAALREQGYTIWATDLDQAAVAMDEEGRRALEPLPDKLALVIGNEGAGVTDVFLEAADRRVFLPMYGFTESFNVSVATALVLHTLFTWKPGWRGNLSAEERAGLRDRWYDTLSTNPANTELINRWRPRGHRGEVRPLDDIRRPWKSSFVPKKIRKRVEQAAKEAAAQEAAAVDAPGGGAAPGEA